MKRIFFVEDDASLRSGLTFALEKQGYAVTAASTQAEAEALWQAGTFDLVILDVSLPDGSGYDLCRSIRQTSQVPLIFLTAADEETEVIMGLDLGGDDYITKPFKLAVFFSRVNALLRRSARFPQTGRQLVSGGIAVDLLQQTVTRNGSPVDLTATEYKLLCFLMENPGQVLSADQILGRLWDCEERYIDSSTLTVYIRRLRTKIEEDPAHPQKILTVRGMGYKWSVTP
ncbi:response regulator transcription factor [Subdoligranulum variabile]|uniref:response regulator transcription factor n=1 Tax=Subdoligranulum variabile TaxID=214851 RepID=UPI0026EB228A|nr:response regulator transcription factor [Subdoligranulum variabile]